MSYGYDLIRVNGRDIALTDILNDGATPQSSFEASLFAFIREWYGDKENFLQSTSGSTGVPKPILISRKSMIASALLTQQALELKVGDTALLCLDTSYIAGKMMLVRAFVTGMRLVVVDPALVPFARNLDGVSIDFAALVPAQLFETIHSEHQYRLNEIRNIIVGGAPLNAGTTAKLSRFAARIFLTYGMTETVSHVALQPVNGPFVSEYFKVLPGVKINTDERGCLEISAPYLNGKITSNDIVELKSPTEFKWVGRWDNVINSGGVKIIPEKIEAEIQKVFNALHIQNRYLVSSVPDPLFGEKLIVIVEGDLPASPEQVRSALEEVLPPHHVPKQIVVNAALVMTENGKINRQETRKKIGI